MVLMNKYYKELIKMMAKNEKEVDKLLRLNYSKALSDIKKTILEYTMRYEKLSYSEWLQYNRLKSLEQQINIELSNMYEKNHKVINDNSFKSYEENYFGLFYELEQDLKLNLSFTMLNEDYVRKAIEYPVEGLKLSERLYGRNLNNLKLKTKGALIDGIINDRGYKKLAIDISNIGVADYKQSLRIAITEGGRLKSLAREDSYQEAKRLGIDLKKRWLSTLDHKTRDSHRALDGVTIGIDEEFEIRGYKALQPRLFGVASEDIRCRCDTITIVEGIDPKLRRDNVTGEAIEYKSYNEWYQNKVEKYGEGKVKILDKMERNKSSDKRQHKRYKKELGKLVPNIFESFQDMKYNDKETWDRLSYKYKLETVYNLDRLKHTENFASKNTIKHILEGELNKNNPRRIKAVGFHMENIPTKKGEIIESTRSKIDKNGVYSAKVIIDGVPKTAKSTFFPTNMTPQQVVNAINEAYYNRVLVSKKAPKFRGTSKTGITIDMYVVNDKITTAYPIYKE
ncbi:hypothetical protein DP134_13990 [Clostridium tetani]|nr:hypothetical protein DP134_13990 [Clostridium tetani]